MSNRSITLSILLRVLEKKEYLKRALDEIDPDSFDDPRNIGFIRREAHGVVDRMMELDAIINSISKIKIKRMHPVVRNTLRMGAYEILYMDSVPDSAAVNECVQLVKKRSQQRSVPMVNALLRRVVREKDYSFEDLSLRYSMPRWIVDLWQESFGTKQTEQILASFLRESPIIIRVNKSKISTDELMARLKLQSIDAEPLDGFDMALKVSSSFPITITDEFKKGLFYVQSPGSISVCLLADIKENDRIIDVCASPGGKSIHAADIMGGSGYVRAQDVSEQKLKPIRDNCTRCSFFNIETRIWDARVCDDSDIESFDVVLADVPCSGLGVIGRKPEIKYRVTEESVRKLAAVQAEILDTVSQYTKKGGTFVYSTCTLTPYENELQIEAFLQKHTDFNRIKERRFIPGIDGNSDGFYICVMKRQ